MTDEEKLAIEIVNNLDTEIYDCEGSCVSIYDHMESACLAGIKAGKPKWHDLRKDPKDLPTETGQYLTDNEDICIYDTNSRKWRTLSCMACKDFDWLDDWEIIAWCELPKFEE